MRIITFTFLLILSISSLYSQWQKIISAPTAEYTYIINHNGILYAATAGSGIYISSDSTMSWQQSSTGLNTVQSRQVAQLLSSGSSFYSATTDGIYKSTDSGLNWTKKSNGIIVGGGALYEFTNSIYENNGVLFTGAYTGIYRSTNNAENWIVTNISGSAVEAKNFVNHNGILFAARETNNQPYGYESTDNGLNWTAFINNGNPIITFLSEGNILWAGTIDGVWITTDNGQNWSPRNNGLTSDPYSSSLIRVNGVLITSLKFGGSGMYKSTNDGLNWINIGEGLPFLSSIEFLMTYGNIILAATSDGIYKRNISEIVTSVMKQSSKIPESFSISQNYPNPFNPSTKIEFSLPSKQMVTLKIYDINGKEITNLVNEELPPGYYSINWDATERSSGIYFYKLNAGSFSETKRMVLVK